jgi:hypothetical protein
VILYHWTLSGRAEEVRRDGFHATTYDASGDGLVGVWVCDDREVWKQGCDVCLILMVPDHLLDPAWAPYSAHPAARDWVLPVAIANRYLVPSSFP